MATPKDRSEPITDIIEQFTTKPLLRRDLLVKSMVVGASVMGLDLLTELPASAATLGALNTTTQLHVVGRAHNGRIYHTIRFSNSWQSSFGDVNGQESNGNGLRFKDVDCSGINHNLHVTALGVGGVIYHTIRFANGTWQSSFGNVNAQESNSGLRFNAVGAAGTGSGKLHVVALSGGVIYHTIRFANGTWQSSFGNVNGQESNSGLRFKDVDCATIGEDLHVTALGTDGVIYHTIRFANGTWQSSFGNVNGQESNSGLRFKSVGCASIGASLHVTAVGVDSIIYHTIRNPNGSWQSSFGNVNAQESNSNLRFKDVDCANVGNNLHVTAIGTDDVIYHTIRFSNSWQSSFGNVNAQESNSNLRFTAVGAGGIV